MATAERQEVKAVAKWVRVSPRKARLVVEHIRGRSVPEARTVLAFTQRAAAREVEKVLRSAVANAATISSSRLRTSTRARRSNAGVHVRVVASRASRSARVTSP